MIATIAWNVNYLTDRACLFSNCDEMHDASLIIAIYATSFAYFGFILSFTLRLVNLFQGSAFEIAQIVKRIIQATTIFGFCLIFCSAILYTIYVYFQVYGTWFISMILFCFCLILYIVVSIILLKLMINKIDMFTQFTAENNGDSINNSGNCFDDKKKVQIETYFDRLTKRLIVLYSIALFSSLIFECVLIIVFCLDTIGTTNGTFYNIFFEYFRLLLMIDTIINSACLLLQSQNAAKEYYQICIHCQKCIIPCCMSNLQTNCICGQREVSKLPKNVNVVCSNTPSTDE